MNAFSRMILWALTGLLFPLQIASAQDHQITLFPQIILERLLSASTTEGRRSSQSPHLF